MCLAKLVAESIDFLIEAGFDTIKVDVVALFILLDIELKVPRIRRLNVDVLVNAPQNLLLLDPDLLVELKNLRSQVLHVIQSPPGPLENDVRDENIRVAHEL